MTLRSYLLIRDFSWLARLLFYLFGSPEPEKEQTHQLWAESYGVFPTKGLLRIAHPTQPAAVLQGAFYEVQIFIAAGCSKETAAIAVMQATVNQNIW